MDNRFKKSVEYLKKQRRIYNATDLANITGKQKSYISELMTGKRSLSEHFVRDFTSNFPEISMEWLLTGSGDMLKKTLKTFDFKAEEGKSTRRIPIYDTFATAGFLAIYNDMSPDISDYLSIPNLPPVDGAIYARGDSMSPLIESGDIVIFKKVGLQSSNIIWGSIYIISYSIDGDDYTVLKYIRHSMKEGCIRLDSFNSRFDPIDIPASSITALALVKASITFHTIG